MDIMLKKTTLLKVGDISICHRTLKDVGYMTTSFFIGFLNLFEYED